MTVAPESPGTPAKAAPEAASPSRRRHRLVGTLGCLLGLLIGLTGLMASRLGQLWPGFDVFSQLTLQFAVVTAAFIIGFAAPRGRVLVALVLAGLGFLAIGLWPVLAERFAPPALATQDREIPLKIVEFNSYSENPDWRAVVAEVERLDADVVALVELNDRYRADIANALKDRYPYQANCFAETWCEFAIVAKHPIAATSGRLFWEGPPYLAAQFGPELGGVTVYAVHTLRFPHSRAQLRQMTAFAEFLNVTPGRKLVAGDFNSTPFSRLVQDFATATGLRRLSELPSWPSWIGLPQIAIDHVFVSRDIRLLETERLGNPAGSDHYPIMMRVAIPRD